MEKKISAFVIIRIMLGCLLVISGIQKIMGPYQNFLYVVQSYAIFPSVLESVIAYILPWIELIFGVFLLLGFWLKFTLNGLWLIVAGFIFIVTQALIRKLPLVECGCFGSLFSFPLPVILILDSTILFILIQLSKNLDVTRHLSLDRYFERHP